MELAPIEYGRRVRRRRSPFRAIEGCDYVAGPSPAVLKANGKRFVCRYLSTPGNPKNLSRAEAAGLLAAGIEIVLVFETTGATFLGGHAAGVADARLAQEGIRELGAPHDQPCYFTVDRDPHGFEREIVSYLLGAASVHGWAHTGVYGGYAAVAAAGQARACRLFWQTYAWSYGQWYGPRHLEQYANGVPLGGHTVDLDRALRRWHGAWRV